MEAESVTGRFTQRVGVVCREAESVNRFQSFDLFQRFLRERRFDFEGVEDNSLDRVAQR